MFSTLSNSGFLEMMTFKEFKEFSLIILTLQYDAWLWFLSNFGEVFSNLPLTIQSPLIFFSISPSLLLIYSRKWIHWARGTPDVIWPFSVVFGSLIIQACNHSMIGWPRVSWANSQTEYARKNKLTIYGRINSSIQINISLKSLII